jgi:hypothetical protein
VIRLQRIPPSLGLASGWNLWIGPVVLQYHDTRTGGLLWSQRTGGLRVGWCHVKVLWRWT